MKYMKSDRKQCDKCICITCERMYTCSYCKLCDADNGQTQDYVTNCKDYIKCKENNE